MENEKAKPQSKSPIDYFFKLGEWVTKGDPARQADFTYYMIWILFSAFAGMFVTNLLRVLGGDFYSLIWMAVGFAIMSLQYFTLKSLHQMRKLRKENPVGEQVEEKIEDVDEMLRSFKSSSKEEEDKKIV